MVNVVRELETYKDGKVTIKAPYITGIKDDEVALIVIAKHGNKDTMTATAGIVPADTFTKSRTAINYAFKELCRAVADKIQEQIKRGI